LRNTPNDQFAVDVSLSVVLGSDEGGRVDCLWLPRGSYVTVGFTDETVIDGPGDDIFISEVGAAADSAEIYVSSNNADFVLLGRADPGTTSRFDLEDINFRSPVTAVRVVGLDLGGASPGYDLAHVRVLPDSIGRPVEVLRSPIHTKFNTFLGTSSFLELTSAGSESFPVKILLFNLEGRKLNERTIRLDHLAEIDTDINAMLMEGCRANPNLCNGLRDVDGNSVYDTYGLIRLEFFEEQDENKTLLGRLSTYRKQPNLESYDFAFARE